MTPPASTTDPLEGTRYRTVATLGEGSMGRVLAVEHRVMKKPFAVKVLNDELAEIPELVDRFILEAQVLARLEHPNIVRVVDVAETPAGRPFYVMERLVGRTLADEIFSVGPLSIGETLMYMRQLTNAVQAAHEAGVVHRDLKPENVFLVAQPETPYEKVKLLDFGVAKIISTEGGVRAPLVPTTQPMVGSPRFMAPELMLGKPADERSDFYSLGLLMHFMLRGALPFAKATTVSELCRVKLSEDPELLDRGQFGYHVPVVAEAATERAPERRVKSAAQLLGLIDATESMIHGDPKMLGRRLPRPELVATPAVPSPTAANERGPFRWPLFVGALLIALVFAGLCASALGVRLWGHADPRRDVVGQARAEAEGALS